MTPFRIHLVLFLLVVSMIVLAGCMQTRPPTTPIPTGIPIPSTPVQPSLYWIKIDPISDKEAGDIFTINSTTNISAGEEILVLIYPLWPARSKSQSGKFSGGQGTVNVIPGMDGNNTISFIVNSSAYNLYPDTYVVVFEDATIPDATGYTRFNIIL